MTSVEVPRDENPLVAEAAPGLQLRLRRGAREGMQISCRRVLTLIGSRPGCKVSLRHPMVAPVHTAIINNGHQIWAVDLVTPKGALLNGLKMEYEQLGDGDVLTVHPWEFQIELHEPTHAGKADVHPFGLDPTPHLVVLEHIDTGRVMQPNRDVCLIGRLNGCDIVINDRKVSRVHALLLSYFGHPAVCDLLTPNHTYVNDEPFQFRFLKSDDVLTISDSRFRVRLVGSPISERVGAGRVAVETTIELSPEERSSDLVDIQTTESSQPWRIAESLQKTSRQS